MVVFSCNAGQRIQKLDCPDNIEKSYPRDLNRKEDRKGNISVGFAAIVGAGSCAGFHP
jgi:hypothetical protein